MTITPLGRRVGPGEAPECLCLFTPRGKPLMGGSLLLGFSLYLSRYWVMSSNGRGTSDSLPAPPWAGGGSCPILYVAVDSGTGGSSLSGDPFLTRPELALGETPIRLTAPGRTSISVLRNRTTRCMCAFWRCVADSWGPLCLILFN